ncbi:MAG: DUF6288 domain-containing protein [Verrucomicrobiota bacterium]
MKTEHKCLMRSAALATMITCGLAAEPPKTPPDVLTQRDGVDLSETWNLGATGMRGWIYTRPASNLDSQQGRISAASRQILVTDVGPKTPADGVMKVDDVIIGVSGKPFTDDARKTLAKAITEAEKSANQGRLALSVSRGGKTSEVLLKLKVMGSYSSTAPYNCPKSTLILAEACKALEKESLDKNRFGSINALALLATGNPQYLPKVRDYAHLIAPADLHLTGCSSWMWGYDNLFLCEYYLLTNDKQVFPALQQYTIALAKGQGMYGTFGHGGSDKTPDGQLHGSIPPYGPVNAAGLIANIAIVMGKKCGVSDPEIEPAIERAAKFFGYFVDKGSVPYGEHMPWASHDNNGKNAMAAVMYGVQGNRVAQTQYYAKMVTASYQCREYGHTGQGFSYLWGALGANMGGPAAAAAFIKEAAWHLDLMRRSDGSFTYDGGEQHGPGQKKPADNTYFAHPSYYGISPTATYVLTYSLPLKKLCITGRDANPANWLSSKDVAQAVVSGNFDVARANKTAAQLVAAFADWSPIARGWAAEELATRPEARSMVPELIAMAEGKDQHMRQGACEALGCIKDPAALPVLVRLLTHQDRWLRVKAANALKKMGDGAKPVLAGMMQAVVTTAEPLKPIVWEDPIQLTHGELAATLFGNVMKNSIEGVDRKLLYPSIQAVALNADGMARATLRKTFEKLLTLEDVQALGPILVAAVITPSPADKMFANEIRMGAYKALTKYHFKEGIAAAVIFAKTQGGHGSQKRTGEIMKELLPYGTAARDALPGLKELIVHFNTECAEGHFPKGAINQVRLDAVEDTIKAIEAATTQPELRSIGAK